MGELLLVHEVDQLLPRKLFILGMSHHDVKVILR